MMMSILLGIYMTRNDGVYKERGKEIWLFTRRESREARGLSVSFVHMVLILMIPEATPFHDSIRDGLAFSSISISERVQSTDGLGSWRNIHDCHCIYEALDGNMNKTVISGL
jgi:hypothetical protein